MTQKILIVDDEKDLVEMIETQFQSLGYEIQKAYSGKEALEKIKQDLPNFIFLDIMMPGLNGYDVCKELKSDPHTKNIPVIMLSAKVQKVDQLQGKESGADGYICKPFEFSDLIKTVEKFLPSIPSHKKAA